MKKPAKPEPSAECAPEKEEKRAAEKAEKTEKTERTEVSKNKKERQNKKHTRKEKEPITPVIEKIPDEEVKELAQKIAKQIESDLKYPGRIKLTMIRETRIVEYAR